MANGNEILRPDTRRNGTRVPCGRVLAVVILLALVAPRPANAAPRKWTSSGGGFTIEAEFVSYDDGTVRLRKPDGKEIEVPLDKLSGLDRRWVASEVRRRRKATEPDGAKQGVEKPDTAEPETPSEPAEEEAITGDLGVQSVEMKLVPLESAKSRKPDPTTEFMLSMTTPQYFHMVANAVKKPHAEAFRKAVQKEPKYGMEKPCLGVARLGSDSYAFAIDAAAKNPKGYDTLYFDANHNGDLTDDKPIEAADVRKVGPSGSYSRFAGISVPMEVDGTQFDFRLRLEAQTRQSNSAVVTTVLVKTAAVREGQIRQGNKSIRVVLLDRNSNGRFDDRVAIQKSGGRLSVSTGDLLWVNPKPPRRSSGSSAGQDQHLVSGTVCIGRHFYKMEVTPAGDRLTLEPAKLTLGAVTNPSPAYRATVYSDDYGVVRIQGQAGQRIPLPVGEWRVADYTIIGPKRTMIRASFANDAEAIAVEENGSAELKFGQPFHAEVRAYKSRSNKGKLSLSLAFIGAGGEQCASIMVGGKRPEKPIFKVFDKKGEVVYQGKFEWG